MTIKQRLFVQKYLEFGNATEAAAQVYNVKNRKVAAQIGYENLRKPDIKEAIDAYLVREDLSPSYVAEMMVDVLQNGTPSQKLEICNMYFKVNGLI